MKIFLTGATGVIGPPTVAGLLAAGHEVSAVARDETKAAGLRAQGATPVTADLFDREAVTEATRGHDAILHLATNVPPVARAARMSSWATHNRLRTEATEHLVAAGLANGVERFVKESVTFTYPDAGDAWITEATQPDATISMLAPTLEGERLALGFADGSDRRAVVLRFGLFCGGTTNRATHELLRLARLRASTVAGKPDAYMSSIHVADAASAVVAALDAPSGVYNTVDDEPLTRREYLDACSAAFDLHRLHATPGWVLRLVAGSAARALTASQRVSNARLRETTAWSPKYPSARDGWKAVAAELSQEQHDA